MRTFAERVRDAVRAAGVPIVDVSIRRMADRSTWTVRPVELQAAAQAAIDACTPDDPALDAADHDRDVKRAIDEERLISAVVWAVIDTYSAPATPTKYQAARTKILAAYRNQPWKA